MMILGKMIFSLTNEGETSEVPIEFLSYLILKRQRRCGFGLYFEKKFLAIIAIRSTNLWKC